MRFALTEEQLEFKDAVRGLLADTCGPDAIRAAWPDAELAGGGPGGGNGRVPAAWNALGEMGVLGLMVPEDCGGLGMTDEDLVPLLIEAGRSALPDPVSATAGVAAGVLQSVPSTSAAFERARELLADIAAGSVTIGVAFLDGDGNSADGGYATLSPSTLVPAGKSLDRFILFTGGQVHLADRQAVTLERLASVDGARCLTRISWQGEGSTLLLDGELATSVAARAFDRAALGAAAQLLGLSRAMTDMTVGYVTERRQFGVPIGTFQAVKHQLANATLQVEFAEPLVLRAAYSLAVDDPDASVHVSMAKAKASTAAESAAATSLQLHGAIGYTVEYDLHLYMKRAWALSREYGDAEFHRRRVRGGVLAV